MYREKTLKRTIIFMRIRRYTLIFLFVIIGLAGAFVLSEFLTDIARLDQKIGNYVMIGTAVTIFLIGFILTSSLEFKIQQAYLEIKMLKKLNIVSFKLSKLLENQGITLVDEFEEINSLVPTKKNLKKLEKESKKAKKAELKKEKIKKSKENKEEK